MANHIPAHNRAYQQKPEQIKKRSQRNAARALVEKKVGTAAIAGKDVGHSNPIRAGGSNAPSNLKIQTVAANRGWETKKGGKKK